MSNPTDRLAQLQRRLASLQQPGISPATLRALSSDWSAWCAWCAAISMPACPATPAAVQLYIADLSESHRPGTISRRLWAISRTHREAGHPTPVVDHEVQRLLQSIRRNRTRPRQVSALTTADLVALITAIPSDLPGLRDRALLLIGWAGAFRESELVALTTADILRDDPLLSILLRRSKTDQAGIGRWVHIPPGPSPETQALPALLLWLCRARISSGAVFRAVSRWGHVRDVALTPRSIDLIVKARCAAVGLDPALYAGHSMRAGLVTSAKAAGADTRAIMEITGHTSEAMLQRYNRPALADLPAAAALALAGAGD